MNRKHFLSASFVGAFVVTGLYFLNNWLLAVNNSEVPGEIEVSRADTYLVGSYRLLLFGSGVFLTWISLFLLQIIYRFRNTLSNLLILLTGFPSLGFGFFTLPLVYLYSRLPESESPGWTVYPPLSAMEDPVTGSQYWLSLDTSVLCVHALILISMLLSAFFLGRTVWRPFIRKSNPQG